MDPSHITLRPFKPSDAQDMLSWAGDERVTKSVRWKTVATKEEASIFIDQISGPRRWGRSICIDDRSVGLVTVHLGSGDERCRGEISYAIGVEHWGKGVATVAVKMAVSKVFEAFPQILRLQAMTSSENTASQRVLEKVGFTKEGLLRKYLYLKGQIQDAVVFSIVVN
ncbi:hypothetical protein ABFX02_14G041500 [Erythranthe guttata]